jgi:hypothetical protein
MTLNRPTTSPRAGNADRQATVEGSAPFQASIAERDHVPQDVKNDLARMEADFDAMRNLVSSPLQRLILISVGIFVLLVMLIYLVA